MAPGVLALAVGVPSSMSANCPLSAPNSSNVDAMGCPSTEATSAMSAARTVPWFSVHAEGLLEGHKKSQVARPCVPTHASRQHQAHRERIVAVYSSAF
jgi:hypothetical protein